MTKYLYLLLLAGLLAVSCSKDDDSTPTPPVVTSADARYQITVDTASFRTDSILATYLKKDGTLASEKVMTNSWVSPVMNYKTGDSAYAKISFYGKSKGALATPPALYLTKTANNGILLTSSSNGGSIG